MNEQFFRRDTQDCDYGKRIAIDVVHARKILARDRRPKSILLLGNDKGLSNAGNNGLSPKDGNMRDNQDSIVTRLFASFTDLETAIESAKKTLQAKGTIPEEVLERLGSYDTILSKQRRLATSLCEHIHKGNWDEVSRHVGLINGLSSMIRDDARAILSSLALNSDTQGEIEELPFC